MKILQAIESGGQMGAHYQDSKNVVSNEQENRLGVFLCYTIVVYV